MGLALVEDATDVSGNFTDSAGTALTTGVLAFRECGAPVNGPTTFVLGDGSGTNGSTLNGAINKGGTFRLVVTLGDSVINSKRNSSVNTGATSTEYHADSDGYNAKGALQTNSITVKIAGVAGRRLVLTARSGFTGNKKYRDTMALSLSLRPAGATSSTLVNPKQIKVGHRTATADGAAAKLVRGTPNTTGDVTLNFPIDTDFGQVVGGTDYYTHICVNNKLGDATTPAAEAADIYSLSGASQEGTTTSQRAALLYASTGHVSGITAVDASSVRSTSADTKASAAIQLFTNSGLTTAGVGVYSTSGYTTTQNIFKRTGVVNTTNAIPFLQAYIADAYTVAMASLSSAFSAATQREFDSVAVDTQTLSTDANGRVRWNFTVAATAAAFNRYVKAGQARQTGSHVSTGPDNPLGPPATFSIGNGDRTAPFPGYGRKVVMTGTGFSASKEPSDTENNVFGVNSESTPDDMWTGPLASASLNANGVPTGAGSREQTLGAGSLKTKWTSLMNEGTLRVIDLTDFCVKDVAGRDIDLAGAESIYLRRALFNDTSDTVEDGGTSLSDSQTSLDDNATFGYHTGTNSLDTIAAPADGASFKYWIGGSDVSATRTAFALTVSGGSPVVGFNADTGNFGYFEQAVAFSAADLTIGLALTPEVAQTDPTVTRRYGALVFRVTPDNEFVAVTPDTAPIYVVYGLNANGSLTQLANGSMTAVSGTTAEFYFDLVTPTGYSAVKIHAFAKISGSRTPGGSEASVQVGYSLDGTDFLTKIPYK